MLARPGLAVSVGYYTKYFNRDGTTSVWRDGLLRGRALHGIGCGTVACGRALL